MQLNTIYKNTLFVVALLQCFSPTEAMASTKCTASFVNQQARSSEIVSKFFERSILKTIEKNADNLNATAPKETKSVLLLTSVLRSYGFEQKEISTYLNLISPLKQRALRAAIESLSGHRTGDIVLGAKALEKARLYEEAVDFYLYGLQFYSAAKLMNNRLKQPEQADKLLSDVGYPKGLSPKAEEIIDIAGKQYLDSGAEAASNKIKSSQADISEAQLKKILASYAVYSKRVTRAKVETQRDEMPLNLESLKTSEAAKAIGIGRLQTINSTKRFLNSLKANHAPAFSDKLFFLSVEHPSTSGEILYGGRGLIGGTYLSGESIYVISKPEILDRNDYHATPSWGTYGERQADSVEGSNKAQMIKFLKDRVTSAEANEIVFENKTGAEVTVEYVKEIWIHPQHRDSLLNSLKEIAPPSGRTWDEIVKGEIYTP